MKPTDLITGEAFRGDNDEKAAAALAKAQAGYNIPLPKLKEVDLQKQKWLEDLLATTVDERLEVDPIAAAKADLVTAGPSAMESVSTDPRLKDQQTASLAALNELATNGGMTAADEANLERVKSEVGQADRGRREAILQNAASRGMGGSGMELLAQLDSSQAATDQAAQRGLDINGMAQARALDAMMKGGQLAGDVRGQDFGEQSAIASAKDTMSKFNASQATNNNQFNTGAVNDVNKFNAGNKLDVGKYNIDTTKFNAANKTDAAKFNIAGKQGVAGANTDTANKGTIYNAGLPQQQFDNQAGLAGGKAGVYGKQADAATAKGNQAQKGWQSFIGGAAGAATPLVADAFADDEEEG